MSKYYYTYKITCLKGRFKDHYYYGQHTTSNLNDGYCGSGKKLKNYYKKYGAIEGETYIKEIIQFYDSLDELNKAEYDLISDKYETDTMCLNLRAGGDRHGMSAETKHKLSIKSKQQERHPLSEETKMKLSKVAKLRGNNGNGVKGAAARKKFFEENEYPIQGKHHSEESKDKIRQARLGKKLSKPAWNKGMTREQMKEYKKNKQAA